MKEEKILYSINLEDLKDVSNETNLPFSEKDIDFIKEKIGDYFANNWKEAIEYALIELKNKK